MKLATDEAITLFANRDAIDTILLEPYEKYVERFNEVVADLLGVADTINSVNELVSEKDQLQFIEAFRSLLRIMNVLVCFDQFKFSDLMMDEQTFADYKSKYLDLYDKVKSDRQKEKISILDSVDFETELIHRDDINVDYIITLLYKIQQGEPGEQETCRMVIMRTLETGTQLRSKKELIKRFIEKYMADIPKDADVGEAFKSYWKEEKQKHFKRYVKPRDYPGLDWIKQSVITCLPIRHHCVMISSTLCMSPLDSQNAVLPVNAFWRKSNRSLKFILMG